MVHRDNRGIGDKLAWNCKFVVGHGVDKGLAGGHRLGPGEGDHHTVAGSGEGYAGPVSL